jgi:hypothetical protein
MELIVRRHDIIRAVGNGNIHVLKHKASHEPPKGWRQKLWASGIPELGSNHVWLLGDAIHPMLPAR